MTGLEPLKSVVQQVARGGVSLHEVFSGQQAQRLACHTHTHRDRLRDRHRERERERGGGGGYNVLPVTHKDELKDRQIDRQTD